MCPCDFRSEFARFLNLDDDLPLHARQMTVHIKPTPSKPHLGGIKLMIPSMDWTFLPCRARTQS